jgi:hypothetical protein
MPQTAYTSALTSSSQPSTALDLPALLAALPTMTTAELQACWRAHLTAPVPKLRQTLLRMALAWELQAQVHGGLPPAVQRRLDQLTRARTQTRRAAPGMKLVREWGGALHVVMIGTDGEIRWNGQNWRSLSEVARAITGTRWSGPAFFGLKTRSKAA